MPNLQNHTSTAINRDEPEVNLVIVANAVGPLASLGTVAEWEIKNTMQKLNKAFMTATMFLLVVPGVANADSWICEHENLVREINVERETDARVPCSVVYNKDSEGQGSKVLWTASADGAYCDVKADGLADKLRGFGWTCSAF